MLISGALFFASLVSGREIYVFKILFYLSLVAGSKPMNSRNTIITQAQRLKEKTKKKRLKQTTTPTFENW